VICLLFKSSNLNPELQDTITTLIASMNQMVKAKQGMVVGGGVPGMGPTGMRPMQPPMHMSGMNPMAPNMNNPVSLCDIYILTTAEGGLPL